MANTVMVTGADGFIGSHFTEELVRKGRGVKAFCYYNSFGTWGWSDQPAARDQKTRSRCLWGTSATPTACAPPWRAGRGVSFGGADRHPVQLPHARTAMWTPTSRAP